MNIDDRTKIPYAVRDGLRQMIVTVVFSLLSLQSQSIVIFFPVYDIRILIDCIFSISRFLVYMTLYYMLCLLFTSVRKNYVWTLDNVAS